MSLNMTKDILKEVYDTMLALVGAAGLNVMLQKLTNESKHAI